MSALADLILGLIKNVLRVSNETLVVFGTLKSVVLLLVTISDWVTMM